MSRFLPGACAHLAWRKGKYSNNADDCVTVAPDGTEVAVHDSKDPMVGVFVVPSASWSMLVGRLKN